MSQKNKNKTTNVIAALVDINEPSYPSMSTQLTEVDPDKGLTPEQLAVASTLSPVVDPKSAEAKKERHPDRLKKSLIVSPTKTVWNVVDQMIAANPAATRKEIIGACISMGIAFYTARTQYQLWKEAKRADQLKLASGS